MHERYKYLGFSNSGKARILSFQKCHTSTRCVGTLDFGPIFFRVLVVAPASLVIATTVAKATRFNPVYLQVLFSLNLYCVFILRIFQRALGHGLGIGFGQVWALALHVLMTRSGENSFSARTWSEHWLCMSS